MKKSLKISLAIAGLTAGAAILSFALVSRDFNGIRIERESIE